MTVSNTKINDFFTKYVNNKSIYIIIIIGIVFMLLPDFGGRKTDKSKPQRYVEYSDEERLSEILSDVRGAGRVSVMITYYGTAGYDLAYEEKKSENSEESSAVFEGDSPFVKSQLYPKVKGVIIVSEGAAKSEVKKALTDAAAAVLEVSSYRICVLEGKERN